VVARNPLMIHLLGEMTIRRLGEARTLPPSRKTRALLAYLALQPRRQRRENLCQLIWEGPSDPRAALRWSLSKLKPLLSTDEGTVLIVDRDGVELDRARCRVDVIAIRSALQERDGEPTTSELQGFDHELQAGCLTGLHGVGGAELQLWIESEREAVRKLHRQVLDLLIERSSDAPRDALPLARKRVALDPLHTPFNLDLLRLLLEVSGLSEAQTALATMRARYRAERLSDHELRLGWQSLSGTTSAAITPFESGSAGVETRRGELATDERTVAIALPDRPSVAVLGFRDLGAHESGSVLANGLAVDLTSRLSQLPHLFVTARASSARFANTSLPPREIGSRLGVRYLLAGTTQRHGKRVRITVDLLDATDDTQVWSEHFDRPVDDLFLVQDDITNSVIAAIEPVIEQAEMRRAWLSPPDNLNAWECYHRGLWHCFRFTADDNEQARAMLQRAIALDPRFSRAYAGLSFTHYARAFLNSVPNIGDEIERALDLARQSVSYDGRDSMGHWCLGRALFLSREHDQALGAIDRALATNPNYAQGHYARGFVGIHAGQDEAALPRLEQAQRLSPFDPLLFAMKASRAVSLANRGHHEEAAAWAVRASQEPNAHFHIYAIAAGCLELAGQSVDARKNALWAQRRHPGYSLAVFQRSFPHKDEHAREPMLAAMERAGIPRAGGI
jgi:TolB-like protein/DNA-binding SARP family transcriptional activator